MRSKEVVRAGAERGVRESEASGLLDVLIVAFPYNNGCAIVLLPNNCRVSIGIDVMKERGLLSFRSQQVILKIT